MDIKWLGSLRNNDQLSILIPFNGKKEKKQKLSKLIGHMFSILIRELMFTSKTKWELMLVWFDMFLCYQGCGWVNSTLSFAHIWGKDFECVGLLIIVSYCCISATLPLPFCWNWWSQTWIKAERVASDRLTAGVTFVKTTTWILRQPFYDHATRVFPAASNALHYLRIWPRIDWNGGKFPASTHENRIHVTDPSRVG